MAFTSVHSRVADMAVKECCYEKLSPNKKSIFGSRMWSQILYLLLASCLLGITSATDSEVTCANVKTLFEKNGMLTVIDLQAQPNSDANQLCLSKGCCGSGARDRLTQAARTQLESALWSELSKLADTFTNRAIKFDEFFRRLLKQSREDFHNMFKRTYGMIYEQHSYLFEELFEKIERYYTRGDLDFDLMMDGFFGILYNKMFIVLNSQYAFDQKYINCVNDHMREIQPFADVPNKLSAQLRRAMVATRTFHKALRSAADVVRSMMQMQVTTECVTAWTRLRYCGSCAGYQPPACSRYCHNVIRGCLPAHADLGVHWEAFLDAADKVSDRLLGPFNIAMVVEPLNIKVSEAIMSFQERNGEISQQIFTVCGKPVLSSSGGVSPFFTPGKQRRSVRSIPDFDWPQKDDDVDDFEIEASFESLMNHDPSLAELRSPESIRKVTEEMAEQAKLRERFLQYMRGHIDLEEYEEHERRKREADPEPVVPGPIDIEYKPLAFGGKKSPKKKKTSTVKYDESRAGSDWAGPALEKLVHETQGRIRNTRHYWNHLPALLCTTTSVTSSPCFNGSAIGSYIPLAAGEGSAGLPSNPEVRGVPGASATGQSATLRALAGRLNDAYNGLEVQWVDDTNADLLASSSFHRDLVDDVESGSGSGDYNNGDGLPDDDEDRQSGFDTGSGDNPPDEDQTEPEPELEPRTEPQPPPPSPTPPTPAPAPVPSSPPIITEAPFTPRVIDTPLTKNVQMSGSNVEIPLTDTDADLEESDDVDDSDHGRVQSPGEVQPVAGGADRPSLHAALIAYALPVVCAWFGTIITDLF